jgi:hypothetical protein|tara:strand:+ start:314 stop:580 length:267 start_codon:yes stop_codon:yes gene_type:complete
MTVKVIEKGFAKKDSVDVDLIIGESKVRPGHYWVFQKLARYEHGATNTFWQKLSPRRRMPHREEQAMLADGLPLDEAVALFKRRNKVR